MTATRLRFGIVIDSPVLPAWAAASLNALSRCDAATLALVVVVSTEPQATAPASSCGRLFRAYLRIWVDRRSQAMRPTDISAAVAAAPVLRCRLTPNHTGGWDMARDDVAVIRALKPDVLIHFSRHILAGPILEAAQFGVWTFRHAEDERRGLLPGFGEVVRGEPVTIATLQRLSANGEAPVELHRGVFKTRSSYGRNRDALCFGSAGWCAQICNKMVLGWRPAGRHDAAAPVVDAVEPHGASFGAYVRRRFRGSLVALWRRLFFLEIWNIAILAAPREALVRGEPTPAPSWLPAPRALRFHADPFALVSGETLHILFEAFGYGGGKGWVSRASIDSGGRISSAPLFVLPCHMSYPFLIEKDGRIFCVPETGEANKVLLFEAINFPDRWSEPTVLIEDFPALDSTLFEHEGRWWLFCTSQASGPELELHAWYSDALRGPWRRHPFNPLTCDVRSSRSAGPPFLLDGVLHRPAQDCSGGYGGAVTINRIDVLTPDDFSETAVAQIRPDPSGPYPAGLHTFAPAGRFTIIDGKRFAFCPIALPLRLLLKVRAKRRRARLTAKHDRLARKAAPTGRPASAALRRLFD
jgi:hypothetical protein